MGAALENHYCRVDFDCAFHLKCYRRGDGLSVCK